MPVPNWTYNIKVLQAGLPPNGIRHVTSVAPCEHQEKNMRVGERLEDWPVEGLMVFDPITGKAAALVLDEMSGSSTSRHAAARAR